MVVRKTCGGAIDRLVPTRGAELAAISNEGLFQPRVSPCSGLGSHGSHLRLTENW